MKEKNLFLGKNSADLDRLRIGQDLKLRGLTVGEKNTGNFRNYPFLKNSMNSFRSDPMV